MALRFHWARAVFFCSLPLALRGRGACRMLTKSGILQSDSRAAQNSRTADTPGAFTTTNASERSPQHRAGPDEIRLADIIQTVRDTLRLKAAHEDLTTYNAAQKLLYTVVILAGLTDGHIQNFVPGVWPPTASTRLDKPPVPNSRRPDVLRANSKQSACQSQPKL